VEQSRRNPGGAEDSGGNGAPETPARPYHFGDLLALARAHWIRRMSAGLAELGYRDYRATDAIITRLLGRRGSVTISEIGVRLGVTRQAARKLVDALERRGYATEARDHHDARSVKITLTPAGESYASAVVAVIHALNHELAARVSADDLAAADTVLRASITSREARAVADRIAPPRRGASPETDDPGARTG
jgi:DNA-binding MarR family transcriptional regulator